MRRKPNLDDCTLQDLLCKPITVIRNSDSHRITAWFTVGLACFTALLAIAAIWGLHDATESTRTAQQAYMFVAPSSAFNVSPDGILQGYILIGNSGRSFAKKVTRYAAVRVSGRTGPTNMDDLSQMEIEEGEPIFAPPVLQTIFRELPNRGRINSDDYRDIQSGTKRIYVFGTILYEDILGKSHKTEFCHMYFGAEMGSDARNSYLASQAKYCHSHNDAN